MKTFEFNSQVLKPLRKRLRNHSTDTERKLWQKLRKRQFHQLRFVRQYSVGSYILDFYCPDIQIAIELDGGQHLEEKKKKQDQERSAYLQTKGILVLRFWNHQVFQNLEAVLKKIEDKVLLLRSNSSSIAK